MSLHKLRNPIYPYTVYVIFEPDFEKAIALLPSSLPIEEVKDNLRDTPIQGARTLVLDDDLAFISWFPFPEERKFIHPGIVAHEMLHVTSLLMQTIGMPLNDDTDEAYCYFIQFLVDKLLKQK